MPDFIFLSNTFQTAEDVFTYFQGPFTGLQSWEGVGRPSPHYMEKETEASYDGCHTGI